MLDNNIYLISLPRYMTLCPQRVSFLLPSNAIAVEGVCCYAQSIILRPN